MKSLIDKVYYCLRKIHIQNLDSISYFELASFLSEYIVAALRGLIRFKKVIFIGRRVKVKGKNHLFLNSNVKIGDSVLLECFSLEGIILESGVTIDKFAILKSKGSFRSRGRGIKVGMNTSIGLRNFLHGGGGIQIGDDCLLGPDVRIFSESHNFSSLATPIRLQGETGSEVVIEDNVWVGAGATILPGVTIKAGAIIGAGSVVTSDVESNSIVAGVPARIVKYRL